MRNFAALACAAMLAACVSSPQTVRQTVSRDASEPVTSAIAMSTFDTVWKLVNTTYVDTAFVSSRWSAVRDSLRPRAALVNTRSGLTDLLATTLKHIPDSHFYIIPEGTSVNDDTTDASGGGMTGVSLRPAGEKAVAWRVEPGSPAAKSGITAGESIESVGAKNVPAALRRVSLLPEPARQRALADVLFGLNHALSPSPGTVVKVGIGSIGGGKIVEHTLVAVPATGMVSQFASLPPIAGRVVAERIAVPAMPASGKSEACVGVIAFNIWLPALVPELERAMDKISDCQGIVVDLRGNPGGLGAMVMGFGGYFVDSAQSLGTMRSRDLSLRFTMNPRRVKSDGSPASPFRGPMAIVVDAMTASTSEIFATGMQRIGRARVFGERSAGETLPALMDRLPSGDVFVHAVGDFTDPDGKRIEGTGVVPDEIVPLSGKALSEGRDTAVEAATRWIRAASAGKRNSTN